MGRTGGAYDQTSRLSGLYTLCITEKSWVQIWDRTPVVRTEDFPGFSDSIRVNAGTLPPVRLRSPN
jgi:hypothetical protein